MQKKQRNSIGFFKVQATQSQQAAEHLEQMKKIIEEARKLEKQKLMNLQELEEMKKQTQKETEQLKKLLAEQWFIRDAHTAKKNKQH